MVQIPPHVEGAGPELRLWWGLVTWCAANGACNAPKGRRPGPVFAGALLASHWPVRGAASASVVLAQALAIRRSTLGHLVHELVL